MKICIIRSNAFQTDRVSRFAIWLLERGHQVTVMWHPNRDSIDAAQQAKIDILLKNGAIVVTKRMFPALGAYFLGRVVNRLSFIAYASLMLNKFERVIVVDLDSMLVDFFISKKISKQKLISDLADLIEDNHNINRFLRFLLQRVCSHILANSRAIITPDKRRLLGNYSRFKSSAVEVKNIPASECFRGAVSEFDDDIENKKISILYYGTLASDRGLDILKSLAKIDNIEIKIAGPKVKEFFHDSLIVNLGPLASAQLANEIDNSHFVFIMNDPAVAVNKYSDPNKFYEALLRGVPVIVANGTGISNIVMERNLGFTCQFNDNDVANAILNLASNSYKSMVDSCMAFRSELLGKDTKSTFIGCIE